MKTATEEWVLGMNGILFSALHYYDHNGGHGVHFIHQWRTSSTGGQKSSVVVENAKLKYAYTMRYT